MSWPQTVKGVVAFTRFRGTMPHNPGATFGPQSPGTPTPFAQVPQVGGTGRMFLAAVGPMRAAVGTHT